MPIHPDRMNGQNRTLSALAREARMTPLENRRCDICDALFSPYSKVARFCSRACHNVNRRVPVEMVDIVCRHCDGTFVAARKLRRLYCSVECRSAVSIAKPEVAAAKKQRQKAYTKTPQYRFSQKSHKAIRRSAERAGDKISFGQWEEIVRRYGFACAYCQGGQPKLTIDHVVPLSKGGRHIVGNVVPACGHCNSSKRDQDWSDRLAHKP